MKKFTQILLAALAFGLALSASAATVTNADGTTFTVTTLSEVAAGVRDASVVEDQSKVPSDQSREGYLSYIYDVSRDGGSGTVYFGPALGDNVVVVGGFDQVLTAVTPATATNAIGVASAADVLAAGTTLNATGIDLLAAAAAAPPITTAATSRAFLTWTGSAATQGVFLVHMKLVKAQ